MSRRSIALVVALIGSACGGGTAATSADEPQTAREKQLREARASGEIDDSDQKWSKWQYSGDRADCFFVLGRRCFKTEKAACEAARCKPGVKCVAIGGGPARVSCAR